MVRKSSTVSEKNKINSTIKQQSKKPKTDKTILNNNERELLISNNINFFEEDLGLKTLNLVCRKIYNYCEKKYNTNFYTEIRSYLNKKLYKQNKAMVYFHLIFSNDNNDDIALLYMICNYLQININFHDKYAIYNSIFDFKFKKTILAETILKNDSKIYGLPRVLISKKEFKTNVKKNLEFTLGLIYSVDNKGTNILKSFKKLNYKFEPLVSKSDCVDNSILNARFQCIEDETKFTKLADIDGFFGHISLDCVHTILKSPINVKLVDARNYSRKRKNHLYISGRGFVKLKDCVDINLGSLNTSFGTVGVLLMIYDIQINGKDPIANSRSKYLKYIADYCSKSKFIQLSSIQTMIDDIKLDKRTLTEGVIGVHEMKDFFRDLKLLFKKSLAFIYIESFGSKSQASCPLELYSTLFKRLSETFDIVQFTSMKIDVCITVSGGEDSIVFSKSEFFNKLEVLPNYKLFLCNDMMNLNTYNRSVNDSHKLKFGNTFYDKLNCYSTIEDVIVDERSLKFIPRFACAALKESLYGHRLGASKVMRSRVLEKLYRLKSIWSEKAIKKFDYRIECRVHLFQVDMAIQSLNNLCDPKYFSIMNYKDFTNVFQPTIDLFISNINVGGHNNILPSAGFTFDNIAWIATTEIILICRFLSGNTNTHQIPGRVNHLFKDDSFYCNDYFKIPDITNIVKTIVSQYIDIKDVIGKLLHGLYDMNEYFRNDILCLLEFAYSNDLTRDFINLYFKIRSRYRLTGHEDMKKVQVGDCDLKKLYFNQWLKRNFYLASSDRKSNVLKCAYEILKRKYGGNEAVVIERISKFIQENNIGTIFYNSDYITEKIDDVEMTVGLLILDSTRINLRTELIHKLKSHIALPFSSNKRATENELSRLVHGWVGYKCINNKNQLVWDNYAYGFSLTRNLDWIKNRRSLFKQYFQKPVQLRRIIDGARRFSLEEFNNEQSLAYINCMRTDSLDDDASNLFIQIRKIDIEIMNEGDHFELIKNMTDAELLSGFMSGNELNSAINALINVTSLIPGEPLRVQPIASNIIVANQIVARPRASRISRIQATVPQEDAEPQYAIEIKERISRLESGFNEIKDLNTQTNKLILDIIKTLKIDHNETVINQTVCETDNNVQVLNEEVTIDDMNSNINSQSNVKDLNTEDSSLCPKNDSNYLNFLAQLKRFYKPNEKFTLARAIKKCSGNKSTIDKSEYEVIFKSLVANNEIKLYPPENRRFAVHYSLTRQTGNPNSNL